MSGATLVLLSLAVPAVGAVVVGLLGRWPNVREAATGLTSLSLFAVVAQLYPLVSAGDRPTLDVLEVVPGVTMRFQVEPLGMVFGLVASGLWILTSAYAVGYMRGHHERNQTRFFVCFAVAIFAAIGIAFAGNMVTLFIFYEVLTLSTYPLVTHHGTDAARRAGRVYLGTLLGTSIGMLLLAVIATWAIAGTTDFTPGGILAGKASDNVVIVLLALYAFGTGKAALMPFHRWLPAAMVAPTPVSALLHAVAVVKAGVFTVLKVTVYIFGIDLLASHQLSVWLMWVAAFTLLAASAIALTKDNLKARLAYSTISQLSYIVLGAALATQDGVVGGGMHIAMHAMGKITLFFCAGAIMVAAHKTEISDMDGLGRKMPLTYGAFLVASLSIIGLPPTGGSWSKWTLVMGAMDADQAVFVFVLMTSSLLSIGYLMPVVARGFFLAPKPEPAHGHSAHHDEPHYDGPGLGSNTWRPAWLAHEAPMLCVVPLCLTALGCVGLFYVAGDIAALLEPITSTTSAVSALSTALGGVP